MFPELMIPLLLAGSSVTFGLLAASGRGNGGADQPAPEAQDQRIGNELHGVREEIDRRRALPAKPGTLAKQRERIPTGALEDELFWRRREEMIDQAAFHARYMAAMRDLYDIAHRQA